MNWPSVPLHVVSGLGLVGEGVLLHAHEGRVAVGLGVAAAAREGPLLLLVAGHALGPLALEHAAGPPQGPALLVLRALAHALAADALVDPARGLGDGLGVDLGRVVGGQRLLLVVHLVDGREVGAHPGPELLLVPPGRLRPHEREPVGVGLDLGAVQEVGVERHQAHVREELDDLGEHLLEDGPHPLGAEAVDRAVVERPHAAYPQEPDVLAGGPRDRAAGVDPGGVGEQHHLEHHLRVVGGRAAAGIEGRQRRPVDGAHHHVHDARHRALRHQVAYVRRQQHRLVLHAGLEPGLRHPHLLSLSSHYTWIDSITAGRLGSRAMCEAVRRHPGARERVGPSRNPPVLLRGF